MSGKFLAISIPRNRATGFSQVVARVRSYPALFLLLFLLCTLAIAS